MSELDPSRRWFVKRGLPGLILFAVGCAAKAGELSPTPQTELPAHIRGQLPEAIAQATEEAMRPTPTPGRRFEKPQVSDIKIERGIFSNCSPYPGYTTGEELWGGWIVRLDHPGFYLKKGKFEVEKLTPSGLLIGRKRTVDVSFPPGQPWYIPAFEAAKYSEAEILDSSNKYWQRNEGSELRSLNLLISNESMEWAPVDDSAKEYSWGAEFSNIGYLPISALGAVKSLNKLPNRSYGREPLYFSISFANRGERAIKDVLVFGFLIDTKTDKLLDMLGGRGDVPYGQQREIVAASFSTKCAALVSSDSLELLYWVSFKTHTGMPVGVFRSVKF